MRRRLSSAVARRDDTGAASPRGASSRRALLAVLAIALTARLAAGVAWHDAALLGDDAGYSQLADILAHHGTFGYHADVPTAYRPPLYPAVIALLWRTDGVPRRPLIALQVLMGTATVALVYGIAARAFDPRVALLAAGLAALAPLTCRYTALIMTETLFTFLVTAAVYCWGEARSITAGFFFGLAALTRALVLPFMIVVVLGAALPPFRSYVRAHAVMGLAFLLVIAPWTLRNAREFHHLIPIADAGWGSNLLRGAVELPLLGGNPWVRVLNDPARAVPDGTAPSDEESILMARAVSYITAHPLPWLRARATQYPRLFLDHGEYLDFGAATLNLIRKLVFLAGSMSWIALAGYGLLRHRHRSELLHIWAFPAFVLVAQLPMWVESRYLVPLTPTLAVLVGFALVQLAARARTHRPPPRRAV